MVITKWRYFSNSEMTQLAEHEGARELIIQTESRAPFWCVWKGVFFWGGLQWTKNPATFYSYKIYFLNVAFILLILFSFIRCSGCWFPCRCPHENCGGGGGRSRGSSSLDLATFKARGAHYFPKEEKPALWWKQTKLEQLSYKKHFLFCTL